MTQKSLLNKSFSNSKNHLGQRMERMVRFLLRKSKKSFYTGFIFDIKDLLLVF